MADIQNHQRLKDRIALVTGASRGIGRAVAEAYGAEGAHVLLLARKQESLEPVDDTIRAQGGTASIIPLDLGSNKRVDGLGPALYERFGRLDILVANAGVLGGLSPLAHTTDPDWERTIAINLNANWRLIRTLDPLLKRSDAGRCIFVTSGLAQSARAYWAPYSVSKVAVEALAVTYANETAETPIKVNILDPGTVATDMRAEAYPGEDPATLKTPESVAESFVKLAEPAWTGTGERLRAPL
ncbi:putative oxidoreductase YciK [Methyloligella halotolerans]|uniref:Putative oxidoreductase YciK n=1 Tax=Methyloligella halotolerans TaxID=1177755 RepID=A0A1E2S1N1_9HYPH|nr:SDR family NAD(P)-dependent oxidoreductase [Methyloligella halotolerans]ODA68406.1 putative oxidoreductase YciK [Methyloligella halotolerans]